MKKRIDGILIQKGICTQRGAKNFFKKNEIFVNGEKITDNKFLVQAGDKIQIKKNLEIFFDEDSQKLTANKKNSFTIEFTVPDEWYIILNKPAHFVCSHVSDSHETVYMLINRSLLSQIADGGQTLHSVGRLDSDTEGLLILTTDGALSHFLASPKSKIKKTYFARLKNPVPPENQLEYEKKFRSGVILPAEKKAPEEASAPAELKWLSATECEVTVTEGKFHEVRRLFLAVGNEVAYLKRVAFGTLALNSLNLAPGEYKILKDFPPELVEADRF